jgi:hypothetical protein
LSSNARLDSLALSSMANHWISDSFFKARKHERIPGHVDHGLLLDAV